MPWVPTPYRTTALHAESADTYTLHLDGPPMAFDPGQFNMLYAFGVGEAAISISGDPLRGGPLVHTIRAVGEVTRALRRESGVVGVRGPFGAGWPLADQEGRDLCLVAGGIGLAPLRPILLHVARRRDAFGRVLLLYGARTPADLIFTGELEDWRARDIEVQVTVDAALPRWSGHVGVVTRLIVAAGLDGLRTSAFLCGPEIMMRFAAQALEQAQVPTERTWLSMERNMKCAVGVCGRCQYGPHFICRDGPVLALPRLARFLGIAEW